ncbi:hypothetical protein C1H46_028485 [Malus baccata]|uniref:Uncharacterized protein n=1 Tax=Malus baccata TaxID=106549 RepID=A0A540LHX0_MALBA|nr:hypothetical protein C1H46_028485 [Malus baccata]
MTHQERNNDGIRPTSLSDGAISHFSYNGRHQLLPPEIRHVIGALEYEHLIAQVFRVMINALTRHVTDLTCNRFYQLSWNIYITMAGFRMAWEEMWQWITSVFLAILEESHILVLGWDITSPHPQMFRAIPGISLTSNNAMAIGTGGERINLRDLTDYNYGELAHAFHNTMLLLNQACRLDPFCGGIVIGRVLQRNQPPSCHYRNFFY